MTQSSEREELAEKLCKMHCNADADSTCQEICKGCLGLTEIFFQFADLIMTYKKDIMLDMLDKMGDIRSKCIYSHGMNCSICSASASCGYHQLSVAISKV